MRKRDDPIASTDSPQEGQGEPSFYGRWSRRKRQARDGVLPADEGPLPGSVQVEPPSGNMPAALSEEPLADDPEAVQEPVLTDADMPPLESLGEDDDYSGFMSPGVSEGLRNQALRKLFMSGKFNVLDGLNDYDDDFRNFEALGDIITSDMRHRMEMEAERAKREAEEKARAMLSDESETSEEAGAAEDAQAAEAALAGENPDGVTASAPEQVPEEDLEEPRDV